METMERGSGLYSLALCVALLSGGCMPRRTFELFNNTAQPIVIRADRLDFVEIAPRAVGRFHYRSVFYVRSIDDEDGYRVPDGLDFGRWPGHTVKLQFEADHLIHLRLEPVAGATMPPGRDGFPLRPFCS